MTEEIEQFIDSFIASNNPFDFYFDETGFAQETWEEGARACAQALFEHLTKSDSTKSQSSDKDLNDHFREFQWHDCH